MYKIDRKLPNCIIRIEYNLDSNFFKFDIMEFVFQRFLFSGVSLVGSLPRQEYVFQEFVFQEFVMAPNLEIKL